MAGNISDIAGIKIGHATDLEAATGCTVILCGEGMVAGVDVRGGAPGTRETDLLKPTFRARKVHAILLTGGSAFGLDAASGVMRYLEEQGIGADVQIARVPLVPAAVILDLNIGSSRIRPNAVMGYAACQEASSAPTKQGNIGAGAGATIGKALGFGRATKGGLGTASVRLADGIVVGALVVVNAFGDVVDPVSGRILAGARRPDKPGFVNSAEYLKTQKRIIPGPFVSTTIGVVATDAPLNKEAVNKVAQMAQDGLARTIVPVHTELDGDVLFALAEGDGESPGDIDASIIGLAAAEAVCAAVLSAVQSAETLHGIPAARDLPFTHQAIT